MRILYVSEQFGPHDRRFLSTMMEGGHETFFLPLSSRKATKLESGLPNGVHAMAVNLKEAIKQAEPDLVQAGPLHTCAYRVAQSGFRPLVAMSWGSDILHTARRNPFARRRVAATLRSARVLIADCETVAAAAVAMGFPRQRIVVFPWGIDLARFSPRAGDGGLRQRLGWQDAFVLLHLRTWEPLYGAETVLRTFLTLAPMQPRLRLLMPGGGRLATRFAKLVEASGFADRVYFAGHVAQEELPAFYNTADLYVSASHSDGSSVSLMEALASGLPALVSDIPGNREWVHPGHEGWLFPVGDAAALADKIIAAMNAHELEELGQQARRTAEQRADWTRNKLGLQRAYQLALN
jgi:glycosyltransferase involved in cell wall biosynthesis